jgi:hypothetical protein
LQLALAFLRLAFGIERGIVLGLAGCLLEIAGSFVGQPLGGVLSSPMSNNSL